MFQEAHAHKRGRVLAGKKESDAQQKSPRGGANMGLIDQDRAKNRSSVGAAAAEERADRGTELAH